MSSGRLRGLVGSAPLFTVGNEALEGLAEAVKSTNAGIHVPLAEDPLDEKLSTERFGASPQQVEEEVSYPLA